VVDYAITNAPNTFIRLINHAPSTFIGRFITVYFDDILVYIESFKEHINHLCCVLNVLRNEKL
jgi:hypothetical protein